MIHHIFLDFDGVCHPDMIMRNEPDFCRVPLLWQILRACPNANVVFSTSWREIYRPDELVEFVTRDGGQDLAHRFIGQTPRLHACSDYDPRLLECLRWLENNGHTDSPWLALDDVPQNFNNHPNLYLVDRATGLTEADVVEIIRRVHPAIVFGSEWGQQVLRNVQRMTVDEEYRKSIAKDLS